MKTHVYSWRLSAELKSELERAARLRRKPLSAVLEQAARDWLAQNSAELADDEETQRQLHAERVRETVRKRLQERYGRKRAH